MKETSWTRHMLDEPIISPAVEKVYLVLWAIGIPLGMEFEGYNLAKSVFQTGLAAGAGLAILVFIKYALVGIVMFFSWIKRGCKSHENSI